MPKNELRETARQNPVAVTAAASAIGYALVIGTFAGVIPYPGLSVSTVDLLSHLIAAVNTLALASLVLGVHYIRKRNIHRHRTAMLTAFALILLFLLIYLPKVGGGGTKEFVGPDAVRLYVYFPVLAVHLILSIVSVPVVIHAVTLGLTHTHKELPNTRHPQVGRIAAAAWITSLALGITAYLLLNHAYTWEYTTGAESLYYSLQGIR